MSSPLILWVNPNPEPTIQKSELAVKKVEKDDLVKAMGKAGLTAKKVQVTKNGKTFMQTVYVKNGEDTPATQQPNSADGMETASSNRETWPNHIPKQKIPPAWTDVKFSTNPKADLIATGLDTKGRRQYVYSEEAVNRGKQEKFSRIDKLIEVYDTVSEKIAADASTPPPPPIREVAECMMLVSRMGLRPGSEVDTKAEKEARGASTLCGEDVKIDEKGNVSLEFVGKKGVSIALPVNDPEIASILIRRKKQSGDKGKLFATTDVEMRAYAKSLGGFNTKDFRTRLGTSTAQTLVDSLPIPANTKELKKSVQTVAKAVSNKLGNTPSVALSAYINPRVFEPWEGVVTDG